VGHHGTIASVFRIFMQTVASPERALISVRRFASRVARARYPGETAVRNPDTDHAADQRSRTEPP